MEPTERERQKELFLSTYEVLGVISTSAEACGINRANIYRWQKSDPEFRESMSEPVKAFLESDSGYKSSI